jgi:hypothetical protein
MSFGHQDRRSSGPLLSTESRPPNRVVFIERGLSAAPLEGLTSETPLADSTVKFRSTSDSHMRRTFDSLKQTPRVCTPHENRHILYLCGAVLTRLSACQVLVKPPWRSEREVTHHLVEHVDHITGLGGSGPLRLPWSSQAVSANNLSRSKSSAGAKDVFSTVYPAIRSVSQSGLRSGTLRVAFGPCNRLAHGSIGGRRNVVGVFGVCREAP